MTLQVGEWRTTRDGERVLVEGYNKHLPFPFYGWSYPSRADRWKERRGVRVHWLPDGRISTLHEHRKDLMKRK